MEKDVRKKLRFAPLSDELLVILQIEYARDKFPDSIILLVNGNASTHSSAVLNTFKLLRPPWSWAGILLIIPQFFRDVFYKWVARNRYKWFGKNRECMLPPPEMRDRFLNI